jgi:hypothetical protein
MTLDLLDPYSSDTTRAVESAFFFAVTSSAEMTNALAAVLAEISVDKKPPAIEMHALAMIEIGTSNETVMPINSTITFP